MAAATAELHEATEAIAGGTAGADDRYAAALDRWLGLGGADLDARAGEVWAELGLVGLAAFLWWLGRALGAGLAWVRHEGWNGLAFAAVCGCGAYLLTSVTGHPFLVVEAAVPFWAVLAARPRG